MAHPDVGDSKRLKTISGKEKGKKGMDRSVLNGDGTKKAGWGGSKKKKKGGERSAARGFYMLLATNIPRTTLKST